MSSRSRFRRKSTRLAGYDYTQPGAYFVTICAYHHCGVFGEIINGELIHNNAGKIAIEQWLRTNELRSEVDLAQDEFVVMPNHVHGVLYLVEEDVGARRRRAPTQEQFGKPVPGSLGTIIRAYKSSVTRRINLMNNRVGDRIWQRNYFEHVIRSEEELKHIRRYIQDNPARWEEDRYYRSGP